MIKILQNLRKKERWFLFVSIVLLLMQIYLDLKIPDYMASITQIIQMDQQIQNTVLLLGGKMVFCALGSFFLSIAASVLVAAISSNSGTVFRKRMFEKIQSLSMADFGYFSVASLITRTTNDVMQVQMLIVMALQSIVKAPIMALGAIMKIIDKGEEWTISTAGALAVLILLVCVCFSLSLKYFRKLQILNDEINRITREQLSGMSVLRAYCAEGIHRKKFEKANEELTKAHLYTGQIMAIMTPGIQVIMSTLNLVIYLIGAMLIAEMNKVHQILLFSDMMVFSQYSSQILMAFMMLVMSFTTLPRALTAVKRISEVLEYSCKDFDESSISESKKMSEYKGAAVDEAKEEKKALAGEIEFKNVSFRYPEGRENVLKNLSFHISSGETVAIIGASGSGKTSLLNLAAGLYDAVEGCVLVDGMDVKKIPRQELQKKIGYVPQKTFLFSGNIVKNVTLGEEDEVTSSMKEKMDQVNKALKCAEAKYFVEEAGENGSAFVAASGSNFSGGERQRINIARALYQNPEILILDDSFSALDYKTEHAVKENLKTYFRDMTKIIVTQRIAFAMDIPKIIVMHDGEIAAIGTHDELMKNCEVYRMIARLQRGE